MVSESENHGRVTPCRINVVGVSGGGKSTISRQIADRLGLAYLCLDAVHWQRDWQALDKDDFRARVRAFIDTHEGWVIDGNYHHLVQDLVWGQADSVVWVDPPRHRVMRQVIRRSWRRVVGREELWNGNRERPSMLLSLDPDVNIVLWAWTQYDIYRERYRSCMTDPEWSHLDIVQLRSRREIREWIESLDA